MSTGSFLMDFTTGIADRSEELNASIESQFSKYRSKLDAYHDSRDKVIKASRDVTSSSKKIIFSLQRLKFTTALGLTIPVKVQEEITGYELKIQHILESVASELKDNSSWRYHRQISGAYQEYIEALLFRGFLLNGRIFTYNEVTEIIGKDFMVPETDYILGLLDTTGELMRYAITNMFIKSENDCVKESKDNVSSIALKICSVLRLLAIGFSSLIIPSSSSLAGNEFTKKLQTLKSSLDKVEKGICSRVIRSNEFVQSI
ncbi:Translin [Dipodascopsis uninucleata]